MNTKQKLEPLNAAEFTTTSDDVFGRIAKRYDFLCDLFSMGIHRYWKRKVVQRILKKPWVNMLDVASGTGDIILRVLKHKQVTAEQKIVVSDISPKMLNQAKLRLSKKKHKVEFVELDAHAMVGVKNESIELYSMSLGLKICDRSAAHKEAIRVLKPGGRLVLLEASDIPVTWLHTVYLKYMSVVMPLIGWLATNGDSSAYKYLLRGVEEFPTAEELKRELLDIGFEDVSFERLTLGIVAIHMGRKPINEYSGKS